MHTTNYENAFIAIADDCKARDGEEPPERSTKTVARMQFEMLRDEPYTYTSDDLLFTIYAERHAVPARERRLARLAFFSKGQACLRSSPLPKTYGWGLHFDADGRVALHAVGSPQYAKLAADSRLKQLKAMKSKR